jgi:hypothetical protein
MADEKAGGEEACLRLADIHFPNHLTRTGSHWAQKPAGKSAGCIDFLCWLAKCYNVAS